MGKNIKSKLLTLEKVILQESSLTMKMTMDAHTHTHLSNVVSKEMQLYRLLKLAFKINKSITGV